MRCKFSRLDLELLQCLAVLGYMNTQQIVDVRAQLAEMLGLPVARKAATRVVQRRLRQLVDAGLLRRVVQPVFPNEHTGSKPFVYTLDRAGAKAVSDFTGLGFAEISWQPNTTDRKPGYLFLDHTLAIVDVYRALTGACRAHDVTLAEWTTDRFLRRHPAHVDVSLEHGRRETVSLVPDGFYRLVLASHQSAWLFLEMDMGTMTVAPTHWRLRAWRRKFRAYLALPERDVLKNHFGADSMLVTVVTTSPTRVANLVGACERAGGDERFWFTTAERLKTGMFGAIWRVAGKGEVLYPLLP